MAKTAVILFNLGGPDSLDAVRPFLFNLFFDKAIIRVPLPLRLFLATLISSTRKKKAQGIYAEIGGKSPIVDETNKQATALKSALGDSYEVFVVMRYWHPRAKDVIKKVKAYAPEKIILLPLYPQFSTTTTQSSFDEWNKEAKKIGLVAPTKSICCYPVQPQFINAHVALLGSIPNNTRVLFSAHGLPKKVIDSGDSYQWQVEQTVAAVVKQLNMPELDYTICYQSRVGPMEWIGPSTEHEIKRAGADKKSIVLVPIAFVSEHSETLVELDIEYKHLATEAGVRDYTRIPTLSVNAGFIESLKQLVLDEKACEKRLCPTTCTGCKKS
jgi:protoporphyrin/coproporphyrin ferrochelatase